MVNEHRGRRPVVERRVRNYELLHDLRTHLGAEYTFVVSDVIVMPTLNKRGCFKLAELLVAYGCSYLQFDTDNYIFAIDRQGRAPDFVLNVAPTAEDLASYRRDKQWFASKGVAEYWRVWTGSRADQYAPLVGLRLVGDAYEKIDLQWIDDFSCRGYSEVLGLYVCWDDSFWQFYDERTDTYLQTF